MARGTTVLPGPQVNAATRAGGGLIDFRRATVERNDTLAADSIVMTTATQRFERTIEGAGFVYEVTLDVIAPTAGNVVAAVLFTEDAPWSVFDTVVFRDVNGELVNLPGFDLFIANLANANYKNRWADASALFSTTPGGIATAGSFQFLIDVPVGINRRSLRGILANQDRSQKYSMRHDIAASTAVYTTVPTTLPTIQLNKYYEQYSVPLAQAPDGQRQEQTPPDFGTIHFTTATQSDSAPAPSTSISHFLRRIGNSIRWIALVFRAGTGVIPRNVAQGAQPTAVRLKVGEDTLFFESYRDRRFKMFKRWGSDFPDGVLVYDNMHDFLPYAGGEIGDDYYQTQGLSP